MGWVGVFPPTKISPQFNVKSEKEVQCTKREQTLIFFVFYLNLRTENIRDDTFIHTCIKKQIFITQ
jgi:hypothetical protein